MGYLAGVINRLAGKSVQNGHFNRKIIELNERFSSQPCLIGRVQEIFGFVTIFIGDFDMMQYVYQWKLYFHNLAGS